MLIIDQFLALLFKKSCRSSICSLRFEDQIINTRILISYITNFLSRRKEFNGVWGNPRVYCEIYKQQKYTAASQNFTAACISVQKWV